MKLRTYQICGNRIDVSRSGRLLSVRGDSGDVAAIAFSMNRFVGNGDLSLLGCIIKTRDSAGRADVFAPEAQVLEDRLSILWTPFPGTAFAPGKLTLQLEFHEKGDSARAVWQSSPTEFEVADSLDAGAVFSQEPAIFQQWEKRIDEVYSKVAGSVDHINGLREDIDKLVAEGGLDSIDAKTLNGCAVNDQGTGEDSLWSARKVAEVVSGAVQAIPLANGSNAGLMSSGDKGKLEGLGAALDSVDAKTLNGCAVNDQGTGEDSLWSARKVAEAVSGTVQAIPLASDSNAGLMSVTDKRKLDLLDSGAGGGSLTDALTLTGCSVNDESTDNRSLWTAAKTVQAVSGAIQAIPEAGGGNAGLLGVGDKAKLDGLDARFAAVDAVALGGKTVDDGGSGLSTLWTAGKTAQEITGAVSAAIAGMPIATASARGLLSAADKASLDNLINNPGVSIYYAAHEYFGSIYQFSDGTQICVQSMELNSAVDNRQSPDGYWMSSDHSLGPFQANFSTLPAVFVRVIQEPFWLLTATAPSYSLWGTYRLAWMQKITTRHNIPICAFAIGRW